MKTMNFEQMEKVNGGSEEGCMFTMVLGFAGFIGGMALAPVTAGSAAIAIGTWYLGVLGGCLL